MDCIRNLVDYQFKRTQVLQYFNLFIFSLFYVVPFMLQLFLNIYEDHQELHTITVTICNMSLLATAIYFEIIEFLQFFDNKSIMNFEKVKNEKGFCNVTVVFLQFIISLINFEYLMDFDNIVEQCMFFLNIYYNNLRLKYP